MAHTDYLADAKFVQQDQRALTILIRAVREFRDTRLNRSNAALFNLFMKYADGVKFRYPTDSDKSDNSRSNYDLRETGRRKRPKAVPIYLALLSSESPELATQVYRETGLAERIAMDYRRPARQTAEGGGHSGPIIPSNPPLAPGSPAILPNLAPLRGAIRFPHPHGIYSAAFSPCGKYIAVAGRAGPATAGLFRWNIEQLSPETPREEIATQDDDFVYVAYSPDGLRLVTGGRKSASVWYSSGGPMKILSLPHADWLVACSYSPDGRLIATTSHDRTACVWDASTGSLVHKLLVAEYSGSGYEDCTNTAFFSPDMKELIVCSSDSDVIIYDVISGVERYRFADKQHEGVCSAEYSPDGKFIVTAHGYFGTVNLWQTDSKECVATLGGAHAHREEIWSAEFSFDGRRVVTASKDGFSHVWDVGERRLVARLEHGGNVHCAHFSPDGRKVVAACDDGLAYLWTIDV